MTNMEKTILTVYMICVFFFLGDMGYAECRVYESQWGEYQSIVMENDLVRVSILPDSNGGITEYFFKHPNFNVFMPVENPKFALTKTVAVADTNFGGYKDWNKELAARRLSQSDK